MAELTECPICSERYNRTEKSPKILSCGHTFCKDCLIKSLKYSKNLLCSICRQNQNIKEPEQLITNRTIYDLLYNTTNVNELNNSISSISSSEEKAQISFKIIMIGPAFSGKTSLVKRYVFKKFSDDYKVTVGLDFQSKTIQMNGKYISLQIWDTAGTEMFQSLSASYYRNSAGAIVVFDVSDAKSFESLDTWINFYRENKDRTKEDLIYLVGNKVDLDNRVISEKDAKNYLMSKGLKNYFEVSAKRGDNVDKLFNSLAKDIFQIYSELINESQKEKKAPIELKHEKSEKKSKGCSC